MTSSELTPREETVLDQLENITDVQRHRLLQTLLPDMEQALNLIRDYQRMLDMLGSNDPNLVEARNLMNRYGMAQERVQLYRVMVDGVDITEHPDSIEGRADGMIELDDAEVAELEERLQHGLEGERQKELAESTDGDIPG